MRIKKNNNLGIISRSNAKFSELTLKKIVWLTVRRITNLMRELGLNKYNLKTLGYFCQGLFLL